MDNKENILSKFRNNLESIINDYKNKINEIEKEEEFIRTLGDLINYCKSDVLMLPFYDETILSSIFERVFALSTNEYNKTKTAKYLIEASKNVDKSHFPQYNSAVEEVQNIYNSISIFYENKLNDNSLTVNKNNYNTIIENYTDVTNKTSENGFNNLIENIEVFFEVLNNSGLTPEEINDILNIAIISNLKYLEENGTINIDIAEDIQDLKEENNKIKSDIENLSNLLGDE